MIDQKENSNIIQVNVIPKTVTGNCSSQITWYTSKSVNVREGISPKIGVSHTHKIDNI